MKVELKKIINDLTEAVNLLDGYMVSAMVDTETCVIEGWCIVQLFEDGEINPIENLRFKTIKELFDALQCDEHLIHLYIKQ